MASHSPKRMLFPTATTRRCVFIGSRIPLTPPSTGQRPNVFRISGTSLPSKGEICGQLQFHPGIQKGQSHLQQCLMATRLPRYIHFDLTPDNIVVETRIDGTEVRSNQHHQFTVEDGTVQMSMVVVMQQSVPGMKLPILNCTVLSCYPSINQSTHKIC